MTTNFEEDIDAYYADKEKYTELLHKTADELPQQAVTSENHAPTAGLQNNGEWGNWFIPTKEQIEKREEIHKQAEDLITRMRAKRADQKQSEETESKVEAGSNVKSKGKKK